MDLEAIQLELEDEMVSKGAARYAEQDLTDTAPGKSLLRRALRPMVEALQAPAGRGRPKPGMEYLKGIDPHVLADLTMRRALDCAVKEESITKTCKAVAAAVEWHVKDAALYAASRAIWEKTQERLRKTNSPQFRRASIDGTVAGMRRWAVQNAPDLATKLDDVRGIDWNIKQQVDVGSALIHMFAKATGLVTTKEIRKGRKKSKAIVMLTEGTLEWLEKQNEYHSLLRPVHMPMVVPPTDWGYYENDEGEPVLLGGYRDRSKAGVSFIKTKARDLELDCYDLEDAFDAVNVIQRTAWRVNMPVLRVMSQIWNTGSGIANLPPKHVDDGKRPLEVLPSRLVDMTPEQRKEDPEFKAWATRRRDAHEYNADLRSEVKTFGSLMDTATRFAQYPAFYHPHKLDWRQRAYPVSVFLSPQGDQFNRALIEFAEGQRMGDSENAPAWLAIHGANLYGVDKVSFEERIAWVEEHEGEILESALFPFDCKFWREADGGAKAWPFLAFCFEWLGYRIAGDDFETHLPVALDGSNSGLQHLSAMLRDPQGAKVTCVAPAGSPEDVYQMVADEVEDELERRWNGRAVGEDADPWVGIWWGRVVRKVVKQPTMTYTYSATESGMRNQIKAALRDLDAKAQNDGRTSHLEFTDPLQTNSAAADFLAPIVRDAIQRTVSKAAEAMDFLQKLARVYSKTGLPLRWTTPIGVPVLQYYPRSTSEEKEIYINGSRHRIRINVDAPNKLDKKRASSGVSPNFVHSMDSTHLLWTVLYCNDVHQLESFSMIHDSFGTHATKCDELASVTRETFIALYDEDRLRLLLEETAGNLRTAGHEDLIAELPPLPTFGSFEVESVRESDYFFA